MSVSPFLQSIHEFVEDKKLLDKSGPVIVGVSGGADSIALLHVLKSLGYSCIVCHCNFNLRAIPSGLQLFPNGMGVNYTKLQSIRLYKKWPLTSQFTPTPPSQQVWG